MESKVLLFRRWGYEYRYRIGMDEEMITSYRKQIGCSCACYYRSSILEVRTNFIIKPYANANANAAGEEVIDSERFADILPVNYKDMNIPIDEAEVYMASISYRLEEYWLPDDEIERVARDAMCLVKRTAADPRYSSLHVIPVVVYFDVCTVQLRGELLDATALRSIKPDRLIPFQLWGLSIVLADGTRPTGSFRSEETEAMGMHHRSFLIGLPKERVDDIVDANADMDEACPICLQAGPTYGTQITRLPDCNHVFHNHCILRWLINKKTCPVCRFEIVFHNRPCDHYCTDMPRAPEHNLTR